MCTRALVSFAAALLFAAPAVAAARTALLPEPRAETLPNGLRVIVLEDRSAPLVAVQVWYHVGSKNEVPGKRGLAHLFEHLMFKGTRNVAPEELSARVDAVGGEDNAFTTEDVTAYHMVLPREHLELALWLEADRMRGLALSEQILATEREVVKEEKRLRLENDPLGRAFEQFLALAWTKHPYAWTPAGTLEDLDAITLADARAFYDRWYRPSNAVLVIAGDVDATKALAFAREHFARVPRGQIRPALIPVEPPQRELREKTVLFDTQLPLLLGGYKIPERAHPDSLALDVLATVLADGQSSRLHRALVRDQQLAIFAGGSNEPSEHPGLFTLFAAFLPGVDPASVRNALLAEIERVAESGVTAEELSRAKSRLTAEYVFGLDTVEGKAEALGDAELLEGGWRKLLEGGTRYERVTAADVQSVARRYLLPERLTLVTLLPPDGGGEEEPEE